MRTTWMVWILLCILLPGVRAQQTIVKGVVTDSISGEPLPAAALLWKGTRMGCATDLDGHFFLSVPNQAGMLQISYIGYATKEIPLDPTGTPLTLQVALAPGSFDIQEVVVKPKRERYRKKGNPAVEFVRHMIEARELGDPRNKPYYSYDHYEKLLFAKHDYDPEQKPKEKAGKFDFLAEFIDTLESGVTILPVSEKEKIQTVYYRQQPKTEKRIVKGYQSHGVDEIFSSDGVRQFLEEVFREVDLFQNDIPLFLQRFVSPLSTMGPDYYKYYLLDTVEVNRERCVDLGFVPHSSEMFGFTGHLYVTLDSTYFIQKAVLNVPKDINLNFVSQLTIEQEFMRTPDQIRILTKDDIQVHFKLSKRTKGMYARRLNIYSNHSFTQPDETLAAVFKEKAPSITQAGARRQPEEFWSAYRPEEAVKRNPNSLEMMMERLNKIPAYRITKQLFSSLVSGYIPTHGDPEKNRFEFGPMNATVNHNQLEGTRLRVGGTTTTAFSKRLFLDGFLAYGLDDKKVKYDALVEYAFEDRKEFRKEYPIHSLRFEYLYDINKMGQEYMYTSKDNMMLMIRRQKDPFISYIRQAELAYYHELYNGFAYGATLRNRRESATAYAQFEAFETDGSLRPVSHYDMTTLELKLRYARNEKFYQTRNWRIPITFDALVFSVNHTMGFKGFLGSDYPYQRTDVSVQKRIWLSAFGYLDFLVKGGKVWTKVPYPLLILPNANLSYTIQPETYTNMNALEFINDEYLSWDLTYYMNGNLLNRLPLIKKLKLREVFGLRGLWGHLTDKNNPEVESQGLFRFPETTYLLNNTPYMEASVGVENIFKFLRIDYVWRLTYLNHPNIQKSGVRMTMVLTF
ncbi:MAG: DUF5686 family protein [Parabacteroides sp.]